MDKIYLGLDGGQSSTVALIADSKGRVLGHGRGGPCNHVAASEGRAKFIRGVGESLRLAGKEACFDPRSQEFASVCLGFSGGASDKIAYSKELIKSDRYLITHDAEIALAGATGGEPGVVVIAGTGSIAFGQNQEGKTARAGGWGYIFGDEGGAFDLARQALRAALRWEEGWGPNTVLHPMLLQAGGDASASAMLHRLYADFDRSSISRLAPIVSAAAEQGDEAALGILLKSANQLAALAAGVSGSLFASKHAAPCLSYIGGVFDSHLLLQNFKDRIASEFSIQPVPPMYPPAAGALIRALRLDGNLSRLSNIPDIKR